MRKLLLILLVIWTATLVTGCWDMVEVNNRIFPRSIGIDLNKQDEKKLVITYSYPNINAIGKNATDDERIHVVSETGDSIFQATHDLGTRVQYPIDVKLLKVMVISEEVASDGKLIRQLLDGISRDFLINKMVQLVVVKGSSEDFIKYTITNAKRQEVIEGAVYSLLSNEQSSTSFTAKPASNFIQDMDRCNVSIVPQVIPLEEEIEISGGAIFKDYTLVGYIDESENRAIEIINNEVVEDGLHANFQGNFLTMQATSVKTKRSLDESGENLKVSFYVEAEGQLHQYILGEDLIESKEILEAMQKSFEDELKMEINEVISTMQKVHKADVFKIGDYIRKFHPKVWKNIEEDWEEIYPDIEISVDVKVDIRRRGLIK